MRAFHPNDHVSADGQETVGIRIEDISKSFNGGSLQAVAEVNLTVGDGDFVSIIGPSGCGKSTLFNIVAGLLAPDQGRIWIGGQDVTAKSGHVGYMLQRDLLLPWRSVLDNVILGLDVQGVSRKESIPRARDLLNRFGLLRFAQNYPATLSGGMRQRCAVIRTILFDAPVFLLDEPFSALDAQTRLLMQEWLLQVWASLTKTVFYITHDIEEALFLSDHVYAMSARPGRIIDSVAVTLRRPRDHAVRTSPEFVEMKAQLAETIRAEAAKAIANEMV